jgi:hypothetical protein
LERHGTESYFVLEEGLLAEAVDGRERSLAASVEEAAPPFRFRRLGPRGDQLGNPTLERLASAMTAGSRRAGRIPAGYTYLGQFVDHDLTFDKTKVTLGERVPPAQLVRARRGEGRVRPAPPRDGKRSGEEAGADPRPAKRRGAELDRLTKTQRDALLRDTPLWSYILHEAELGPGKLDGVGARIVAETFHRAMEGSEFSIVRDPAWRPTLGPSSTTFRMVDLLLFAFRGRKGLLAPLG